MKYPIIKSKAGLFVSYLFINILLSQIQNSNAHTYTCQFNKLYQKRRRPTILDKPDQLLADYQHYQGYGHRRNLQAAVRNTIRITLDTNDLNSIKTTTNGQSQTSSTKLSFIKKAMLVTQTFYQSKLKVSTVARVFAPSTCIDFNPSSNDVSNGISASDLHIYVRYVTDKTIGYGATGVSCKWITARSLPDSTYQQGRPTVGRIIFNTYNIVDRQTSLTSRLFAQICTTALHQTMHILGFDSTMYTTYLDSGTANIYAYNITPQVTLHGSRTGGPNYLLKTPKVTAWAQSFFACSNITGMALQNQQTTPGIGSHWERLAMYDQIMTGTQLGARKGFSGLTFALLKDMGWYQVDDAFNDTSNYGYHLGCTFYNFSCYDTTTTYPKYFCDPTAYTGVFACATNFLSKAVCTDQSGAMTDGCGILGGYFHCIDPAQSDDGYKSYTLQKYRTDSFCVQSTFANVGITDKYRGRCYPYKCFATYIQFYIDVYTITCQSNEASTQKTINALNGYLECPNFVDFCQQSRKICQNWCSQNGYCIRGICVCLPGYYGKDCSKSTCTTGQYYDQTTSTCVASCPSGTYVNLYSRACLVCDPACNQCRDQPTICTGCLSTPSNPQYFVVSQSLCVSVCPSTTYTDGDYCRDCDQSGAYCRTCSISPSNCTLCLGGRFLQDPYYGACQTSCSGTYSIYDVVNYKCVSTCTNNLVYNAGGCTVCPNPTDGNCDMCPLNSYKYIGDQLCHPTCPSTYYPNVVTRFCQKCHISCKQCDGGYAENCTECLSSSTNKYLLLSRMCVSSCPLGFYANDLSGTCQLCDPNLFCDTCARLTNGTLICLTCKYLYYLQADQTCGSTCPPLYYKNAWGRTCQQCSTDCGNCTANSSSSCIDCQSGKVFLANVSGKYCLSSCPAYYYYRSGSNCLDCYSTCKTCNGTNSASCLTCIDGLYLSDGMCRYVCPSRSYPRDSTGRCQTCADSCTFCFGPTVDNCTACASGLVLNNFTCTSNCPKGLTVNQWGVCYERTIYQGLLFIIAILAFMTQ